jgi:hypothetical protein
MGDIPSAAMARISRELDRLGQEINATQHVLDDAQPDCREEIARRLRHIAARANQIAEMVGNVDLV